MRKFLVGGAVMCLAYGARYSTEDVYALFRPTAEVRQAASRVAIRASLGEGWLCDGVRAFMSTQGGFAPFFQMDHLSVMVAQPARDLTDLQVLSA
jgi:hypothetical protein